MKYFKSHKTYNSAFYFQILKSKGILIFLFLVAIGSILYYSVHSNAYAIILLFLIGLFIRLYTQNMIVVLFLAITITAMIQFLLPSFSLTHFLKLNEGFGLDTEDTKTANKDELATADKDELTTTDNDETKKEFSDSETISLKDKKVKKEDTKDSFDVQPTPTPTSLNSTTVPPVPVEQEIEKLKLQNSILEKIKGFEPFLNYMAGPKK